MILFHKNAFFTRELRVFEEMRKILFLEKLQNLMKKEFENKGFHPFKRHL